MFSFFLITFYLPLSLSLLFPFVQEAELLTSTQNQIPAGTDSKTNIQTAFTQNSEMSEENVTNTNK